MHSLTCAMLFSRVVYSALKTILLMKVCKNAGWSHKLAENGNWLVPTTDFFFTNPVDSYLQLHNREIVKISPLHRHKCVAVGRRSLLSTLEMTYQNEIYESSSTSSAENNNHSRWVTFADELGRELIESHDITECFGSPIERAIHRVEDCDATDPTFDTGSEDTACYQLSYTPMFTISDRHDLVVKLESASITHVQLLEFECCVRLKPLSPMKIVTVRLTTDNWASYEDLRAHRIPKKRPDSYETFACLLGLAPGLTDPIEFCVKCEYKTEFGPAVFWDNNNGNNYVFKMVATKPKCVTPAKIIHFPFRYSN